MNRKNKFSVGRARAQGLSRGLLPSSGSSAMRCYVSWLSKGVAHGAKSEPPPCPGTGLLEPACRIPPCHPPTGVAQAAAKSQMCCHNGRTEGSRLSFPVTIPHATGCGWYLWYGAKQPPRGELQRPEVPSAALLALSCSLRAVPEVAYLKAAASVWFSVV